MSENLTCVVACLKLSNTLYPVGLIGAIVILSMIIFRRVGNPHTRVKMFWFSNITALVNVPLVVGSMRCDYSLLKIYVTYLIALFAALVFLVPIYQKYLTKKYSAMRAEKLFPWIRSFVDSIEKAEVYLIESAIPRAFTIGKKIFISGGMAEILDENELKAVIAHELYHVRQNRKSPMLKGLSMMTFLPFLVKDDIEMAADEFSSLIAGREYLISARRKIEKFFNS